MKKTLTSIACLFFLMTVLTSCGNKEESHSTETMSDTTTVTNSTPNATMETETNTESANTEVTSTNETSGDCNEFLNGYEKFMDKYIALLKKYKANPNDAAIIGEYSSMMAEAGEWAEKTKDCAADAKFTAKFTAIQMKIANAASGM